MKRWSHLAVAGPSLLVVLVGMIACARTGRRSPDLVSPTPPGRLSFAAVYKVKWRHLDTVRKARLAVAWAAAEGLRLEILGGLGSSRAVLILNEKEGAVLLDPGRRRYLPFESGREAVRQVTGLDLNPALIPAFLLGNLGYAPTLECQSDTPLRRSGPCIDPDNRSTVTLGMDGRVGEVLFETGARIRFRRLQAPRGTDPLIPKLEFQDLAQGVTVELTLKDSSFHPLARDLFSPFPPRGFQVGREAISFPTLGEEIP